MHGVIERAEQDSEESSDGFPMDEFGNIGEEEEQVRLILSDLQKLELDVQALRNDVSILVAQNSIQHIHFAIQIIIFQKGSVQHPGYGNSSHYRCQHQQNHFESPRKFLFHTGSTSYGSNL